MPNTPPVVVAAPGTALREVNAEYRPGLRHVNETVFSSLETPRLPVGRRGAFAPSIRRNQLVSGFQLVKLWSA